DSESNCAISDEAAIYSLPGASSSSPSAPTAVASPLRRLAVGAACAAGALGMVFAAAPFLTPALRRHALPFVPATDSQVANVFSLLKKNNRITKVPSMPVRLIDLGSGDGRIVREAALRLYQATGVELNWPLVLYSRLTCSRLNCIHRPKFLRTDLLRHSLSTYDVVVIFGVKSLMKPLQAKLAAELHPDACVVACRYRLPDWRHVDQIIDGVDSVWLYRPPAAAAAAARTGGAARAWS
ncbi:hypothetical protein BOX15_Mlig008015g3, partial [Macrostomum lignano]